VYNSYTLTIKKGNIMDAYKIVEILDQARQLAEADGYESFPTTMFYSQELGYIQEALTKEAAE